MNEQEWKDIEAEVTHDLSAIQSDKDAYDFIHKYFSQEYLSAYLKIYRSFRHEMNRTPRQAIDDLLTLPSL